MKRENINYLETVSNGKLDSVLGNMVLQTELTHDLRTTKPQEQMMVLQAGLPLSPYNPLAYCMKSHVINEQLDLDGSNKAECMAK